VVTLAYYLFRRNIICKTHSEVFASWCWVKLSGCLKGEGGSERERAMVVTIKIKSDKFISRFGRFNPKKTWLRIHFDRRQDEFRSHSGQTYNQKITTQLSQGNHCAKSFPTDWILDADEQTCYQLSTTSRHSTDTTRTLMQAQNAL
jgi:hypothetical protein